MVVAMVAVVVVAVHVMGLPVQAVAQAALLFS